METTTFGPIPAGYDLGGVAVGDQDPEAGVRVPRGSVVRLNMHGVSPIPSPGVPLKRPRYFVVPRLVGLTEPKAMRLLDGGAWPQITHVEPLPPTRNAVLGDWIVATQDPRAGTRVRYFGALTSAGFRVSVVRLTLTVR